ncbi:PPK2 family polyphosphate kinase [Homoserinimonas sp. OAct 916]|uniref:PPK2 family polyphosphate kinase n=1 Tax=Homoserinimonas sp. OAct 916 TaxID=2211450 RepID=UPI000DBE6B27|nr:PPK2 family polyphosphate kinase [Homoserinimonas sp. OAct 916]
MSKTAWSEKASELLRVGPDFRLEDVDPASTPGIDSGKRSGVALRLKNKKSLRTLQGKLFADSTVGGERSVLLVLQGMDSSGKGGVITHALAGMSASGVMVHGFKAPSAEEKKHGFLWRVRKRLPEPGMVSVFDRSHYEDVLAARVRNLAPPETIERRYNQINTFERYATESQTTIVKVMLHVSEKEQKRRLISRLHRRSKLWKYNPSDVDDRELWRQLHDAYQIAIARTSTDHAPWYVVPADHKWYARLAVQQIIIEKLEAMQLKWPSPDYDLTTERKRVASA